MHGILGPQATVFFDGACNFCNRSVRYVAARDKKHKFHFVPLQSAVAEGLLQKIGLSHIPKDTVILVEQGHFYIKSSAVLRIAQHISGMWSLLFLFRIVPTVFLDFVYDLFATHRYSWFGQCDSCVITDVENRK